MALTFFCFLLVQEEENLVPRVLSYFEVNLSCVKYFVCHHLHFLDELLGLSNLY